MHTLWEGTLDALRAGAGVVPRKQPSWTVLRPPGRYSKGARYVHASGARVHHCGHPTALYPYEAWRADGAQVTHVYKDRRVGTKFALLVDAKAAALGATP